MQRDKINQESSKYMQAGGVFGGVVNVRQGKIFEICIQKKASEEKEKTGVISLAFNIFLTVSIIRTACVPARAVLFFF